MWCGFSPSIPHPSLPLLDFSPQKERREKLQPQFVTFDCQWLHSHPQLHILYKVTLLTVHHFCICAMLLFNLLYRLYIYIYILFIYLFLKHFSLFLLVEHKAACDYQFPQSACWCFCQCTLDPHSDFIRHKCALINEERKQAASIILRWNHCAKQNQVNVS